MLSDIDVPKVTNEAALKAYWECKQARTLYYEHMHSKQKVFLISSLEKPVISIRTDH